jgi:hypothetical protein
MFTVGDFLATEIPRLEAECEAWLDAPDEEFHGRTPRSIIERERQRIPEGMSGREAMHDPDCPCCQMMADMPGVSFWHLDGSAMDNEFAFDIYHRTREAWDEEQREWEECSRRFDEKWAERQRLGLAHDGRDAIWSSSFSVGDTADVPLGVRIFGIGCHLAEVIADLRRTTDGEDVPPQNRIWIDQLNRDFGNLRDILGSTDPSLAVSLFDPVTSRFAEALAEVAAAYPDLSAKCEGLTREVGRLLDPPEVQPEWDADGDDVPF